LTIDDAKQRLDAAAAPRFLLNDARVHVSPEGFHFIEHLDPPLPKERQVAALAAADIAYIERTLHANSARFSQHLALVGSCRPLQGARILDVGCGGGAFLSLARSAGSICTGLEVNPVRVAYSRERARLDVRFQTIDEFVSDGTQRGNFDVVTLWDVIEHVNEPFRTLECAVQALRPGGVLLIDTPARDSFYHRLGELSYHASRGRVPLFLNSLYSSQPFGHKQIFSTTEMRQMLQRLRLGNIWIQKFHEFSFPVEHELERLVRSRAFARAMAPTARLLQRVIPIANKMLAIARAEPA
jgi:2-polyprenyl-6-hydroxyphenyl methylase/3-demethylubiquinone-9 3-methyltransferase